MTVSKIRRTWPSEEQRGQTSNNEKATTILQFMKLEYPRFSLRMLLETIFAADVPAELKTYSSSFMKDDGLLKFMDTLLGLEDWKDSAMLNWVVNMAAEVCAKEASRLTERASRSGRTRGAPLSFFFRVNSKRVTVEMVESFRVPDPHGAVFTRLPYLQGILKGVIGKEGKSDIERESQPFINVC